MVAQVRIRWTSATGRSPQRSAPGRAWGRELAAATSPHMLERAAEFNRMGEHSHSSDETHGVRLHAEMAFTSRRSEAKTGFSAPRTPTPGMSDKQHYVNSCGGEPPGSAARHPLVRSGSRCCRVRHGTDPPGRVFLVLVAMIESRIAPARPSSLFSGPGSRSEACTEKVGKITGCDSSLLRAKLMLRRTETIGSLAPPCSYR